MHAFAIKKLVLLSIGKYVISWKYQEFIFERQMNIAYLNKYGNKSTGPIAMLAILGAIYLLLTMRPFFVWEVVLHPIVLFTPVGFLIYLYSLILYLNNSLVITSSRLIINIILFIFVIYNSLPIFGHSIEVVKIIRFLPLFCITLFPTTIFYRLFNYFHKFIKLFCYIAVLLFFLILLNINLPHAIIPGFTTVLQKSGDNYLLYGLVVSSTNTIYHFSGFTFARVMGPFLEPGHFAIYLGLTLLAERYLYNTTSKIMVTAGLLTFSPAFIFSFLLIIIYTLVIEGKIKTLVSVVLISMLSLSLVSNDKIREEIYYLTIGRNFDGISEDEYLDNRTSSNALNIYEQFSETPNYWVGQPENLLDDMMILSDYRGLIYSSGYLGLILLMLTLLSQFKQFDKRSLLLFLPIVILILAHRSWMFQSPYVFLFLILVGSIAKKNKKLGS